MNPGKAIQNKINGVKMKKRITAILAAAIITVGASVPAFADSDFNTAGNDPQVNSARLRP